MVDRSCTICGKHFMANGNTRTCSAKCSHEQMKITKKEVYDRRRNKKKHKSNLDKDLKAAREAGMSYGIYTAYTSGRLNIEQ